MENNPKAKKPTCRPVCTDEKAREYDQFKSIELFEATGNAIPNRVIPTTAAKRRRPTMVWDAVRAYLQVPETGDVFAIPPPKWNISLVVSGMRTPSGVANATSFPRVLGKTCGATGSNTG